MKENTMDWDGQKWSFGVSEVIAVALASFGLGAFAMAVVLQICR